MLGEAPVQSAQTDNGGTMLADFSDEDFDMCIDTPNGALATDESSKPMSSLHVSFDSRMVPSVADLMVLYYKQYFPAKELFKWLSYGGDRANISNREFAFTFGSGALGRFLSFDSVDAFVRKLADDRPQKIDIGAIYNVKPSERKTMVGQNFRPLERELVFDIDMDDYNDVRTCCQDKSVCSQCWKFLAVAVKIIHAVLTEDFGFTCVLWVFSGRRGVHCWVADPRARRLSAAMRKSIVSYMDIARSTQEGRKVTLAANLPTSVARSVDIVLRCFRDIALEDQEFLGTPARRAKFISNLPDDAQFRTGLSKLWSDPEFAIVATGSADYWDLFVKYTESVSASVGERRSYLKNLPAEMQVATLYPRLDAHVSMQLNHLLKSPFCVHPDTGKVCVPFDPHEVDGFDPAKVLTINDVCTNDVNKGKALLAKPMAIFGRFLSASDAAIRADAESRRRTRDSALDF